MYNEEYLGKAFVSKNFLENQFFEIFRNFSKFTAKL